MRQDNTPFFFILIVLFFAAVVGVYQFLESNHSPGRPICIGALTYYGKVYIPDARCRK